MHPLKLISKGLPVVIVPLILFSDDTSGNKSKKWNKFDYWSFSLANLPRRALNNIYFIGCSNHLSAMDLAEPLVESLKKLEIGMIFYDAMLQSNVYVIAPVMCALCDNARGSELVNHMGSRAKQLCRICMVCS